MFSLHSGLLSDLTFFKEICKDFFSTRFQARNKQILSSLSAVKAFGIQDSNPNWAQQKLVCGLCLSQVSAVTVGLGSRAQHIYLFSDMHWGWFGFGFFFFLKGYNGNLAMWNWEKLLNSEYF